jgi:stress response protein YsnF
MNGSQLHTWVGAAVSGVDGELLGHVSAIYADNATGGPVWATVQGRQHTSVVPLETARFDGTSLNVPFTAEQLHTAPHHNPARLISYADGDDLARHYGLLPAPPAAAPPPADGPGTTEDAVMIRSEEQLRAGTVNVIVGRARLVTSIVTEEQTFTIPVRRHVVRLVHDPLPAHQQVLSDTEPAEEIYETVLYAEQVLFTTQVVPVERVRLVKRVVTTQETVGEQVRLEQVDTELTTAASATLDPPATSNGSGEALWD